MYDLMDCFCTALSVWCTHTHTHTHTFILFTSCGVHFVVTVMDLFTSRYHSLYSHLCCIDDSINFHLFLLSFLCYSKQTFHFEIAYK